MSAQLDFKLISDTIRVLAGRAHRNLKPGEPGRALAAARLYQPIDYMRCAEFDAAQRELSIAPDMWILDVSSPQWFILQLAHRFPHARFVYLNILEEELEPFRHIANACGIRNLTFVRGDVRYPPFAAHLFDRIFSLSVIEHVAPAEGGDVTALVAIRSLLAPSGQLILTLPFKAERNIVYRNGTVFERSARGQNFFAREYDAAQFRELTLASQFAVRKRFYISESENPFALDFVEWGPGQDTRTANYVLRVKRAIEKRARRSLEAFLAQRFLSVNEQPRARLVNIAAYLEPFTTQPQSDG